jgi:hypothetical protein
MAKSKQASERSESNSENTKKYDDANESKIILVGKNGEGSIRTVPKGYKTNSTSYSPKKNRHNPRNVAYETFKKMHDLVVASGKFND